MSLVSTEWLAEHLKHDNVRALDCTTYMFPQPVGASRCESGKSDYLKEHIPGAQHACMIEDLSDPNGKYAYTLPSKEHIAETLGSRGISNDHHCIIYTRKHPMVATRAWWVLTTMGHKDVSILDGGFEKWVAEGREATSEVPSFPRATFKPEFISSRYASADDVAAAGSDTIVVNALMPDQHKGIAGPHYGRPGRIPGSVSVPFISLLDMSSLTWLPVEKIEQTFKEAGVTKEKRVINYCGGV
jgi:thiosulfate/3-mercaptopyruvate sulfurtransferase